MPINCAQHILKFQDVDILLSQTCAAHEYNSVINNIIGVASDTDTSTTCQLIVRSTYLNFKMLIYYCHKYAPPTPDQANA